MPQDGLNNYQYPLGTPGIPNQTIESEKYNSFLDDLVINDLNWPRPIHRGGTGASTELMARDKLAVEAREVEVINYNAHVFEPGSFFSNPGAVGAPLATGHFSGWCYWVNVDVLFIEVRWHGGGVGVYPRKWVRHKFSTWSAWFEEDYLGKTGGTLTGPITIQNAGVTTASIGVNGSAKFSNEVTIGGANPITRYTDQTWGTTWATAGYLLASDTYRVTLGDGTHYAQLTDTGIWDVNILQFNHDPNSYLKGNSSAYALQMYSGTGLLLDVATGDWYLKSGGLSLIYAGIGGDFYIRGNAYKPGGGDWTSWTPTAMQALQDKVNELSARLEQLESGA